MGILEVNNIEKFYGQKKNITKALNGISFSVEEGEFIAIMGASGSGKTTLLNCIATIDTVTTGSINLEGRDISKLKGKALEKFRCEKLGFIFQDYNLLDTLTMKENIALALSIKGVKSSDIKNNVDYISKRLRIEDILNKYPYEVSGGQKQRVACARAIVKRPSLILADEPTGALDSKAARVLLESFEEINKGLKGTILMVTHDPFTASYANRVIFIKDGKLFTEITKEDEKREEFFKEIIRIVTLLGGETSYEV